jgi:hypothetical protein
LKNSFKISIGYHTNPTLVNYDRKGGQHKDRINSKKITRRQAQEKNRVSFSIREELQDRRGGGEIKNK